MTPSEYTLFEKTGSLIVQWMRPTLPVEIKVLSIGLLVLLPFLFFFRAPFARFADRYLHVHWSPKIFGILAPTVSLVCGFLLLFVKEPEGMIYWNLGTTGVSVKSPNGNAALNWSEIDAATFDTQSPEPATLVLKSKEGRNVWLVLSWVEPEHQDKVIDFINQATDNRFNLAGIPEEQEETEDDELPSPTGFHTK